MKTLKRLSKKGRSCALLLILILGNGQVYSQGFWDLWFGDALSHNLTAPVLQPLFSHRYLVDDVKKEVDGQLFIENCYQKVKTDGGEYRLLRDGFNFSRTSTTQEGDWLWFRAYTNKNIELVGIDKYFGRWTEGIALPLHSYIQQVDEVIQVNDASTVLKPFFNVYVADMFDDHKGFAKDFIFDLLILYTSIVKLEIITVSKNEELGRFTFGKSNITTFHIIDKDDIIDAEIGTDQGCLTFNNFQMNGGVNLDGFCGKVRNELALPSNSIDPPEVVSDQFEFGDHVSFDYLGDRCEECINMTTNYGNPNPVACGCKDFVLKTSLMSCYAKEHLCEPLVIYEDIRVCCECDIRDFPLN